MACYVGKRSQSLRMQATGILRIAAGIVVQVKEKSKHDGNVIA